MINEFFEITDSLEKKINLLIKENKNIREEYKKLKTENKTLNNRIEEQNIIINELNKKTETIKFTKTWVSKAKDAHDCKIQINRLVREIDDCIALLNN